MVDGESVFRRQVHALSAGRASRPPHALVAGALALVLLASPALAADEPPTLLDEMNVAMAAKRLCSALYVSEREHDEALANSVVSFLTDKARRALDGGALRFTVDADQRLVAGHWAERVAKARQFGDQGCVILSAGSEQVLFTPVKVESALPPADALPWPMGDLTPAGPPPARVDLEQVEAALDLAFSQPEDRTAAFLAVYRGQILAERYGASAGRNTQLESWSMGKSVTATLIGRLIAQGRLELWQEAPVPEWRAMPGDPRAAIRIADLLRMSSGLFFTHSSESAARLERSFVPAQPDHSLGYVAAIDVFQFAESRPLEHPPNTVGRYRNCDPLVLGAVVKRVVEAAGESYLEFPQRALFDKIGIRRQVLETDLYGNFVMTGFDFGTGRNWARLGLLYLQDGVWQGERLLPEGFVAFVSSPAPAWSKGEYGGLFWVGHPALPDGAYSMRGAGGQEVSIVPSHELVLVRLGHTVGASRDWAARRDGAYRLIVDAVASRPSSR